MKGIIGILKSFAIAGVLAIFSFNNLALALTQKQLDLLNSGSYYYDYGGGCSSNTDSGTSGATNPNSNVFILGDSITERSASQYTSALQAKGFTVNIDASAGRSINGAGGAGGDKGTNGNTLSGIDAVNTEVDKAQIKASQVIVIALGTNNQNTVTDIDNLMAAIKTNAPASARYYWIDIIAHGRTESSLTTWNNSVVKPSNMATYSDATKNNYTVLSWFKTVDPNGDPQNPTSNETDVNNYIDTTGDRLGVHPTSAGSTALAKMVTAGITGSTVTTQNSGCCNSKSTTDLSGSTNALKAMNFFQEKGLTAIQAAGLVGNFMVESSVNVDPSLTNSNGAHGIAQWLGGRKTALENYAKSNGLKEDDLATQLNFSWQELSGPYKSSSLDPLKESTDTDTAAKIIFDHYEIPQDTSLPKRQANAKSIYSQTANNTPLPPNAQAQSSSSCDESGTIVSTAGYHNPFRDVKNIAFNGIDGGVDYTGEGVVHPIGSAVIVSARLPSGWPGYQGQPGAYIEYKLTDGSAKGKYVFVAENCTPLKVKEGQTVDANSVLCTMHNQYPYIESGWGSYPNFGDSISASLGCYDAEAKTQTAYGSNFSLLIESLGGPRGSASHNSCTLPADWPVWK
jgi:hypothetical protein